ncbi:MAG: hypothetical protein ACHP7J_02270 [Terriglobales bacterium]
MKVLRIGSCLLLLLTQTIFMGCSQEKKEKEAKEDVAEQRQFRCKTHPLTITKCEIKNYDVVEVCDMDHVEWTAGDDNYQVTFVGSPVPTTTGSFPVLQGTKVSQVIHGPSDCSDAGCYYKYNLNRIKNGVVVKKPCRDPGIRILP